MGSVVGATVTTPMAIVLAFGDAVELAHVGARPVGRLLLDEPTTYLDLSHAIDVLKLVSKLRDELGRTVVMVLHDLNLAIRYSDELIVMKDGVIVSHGAPEDVISPLQLAEVFDPLRL